MEDTLKTFERNCRSVRRKHRQLATGYVTRLGRNGVIEHRPIAGAPKIAWRALVTLVFGVMALKTLLVLGLGIEVYQGQVGALADGSTVERLGAWLMQIDPVTLQIVQLVGAVMA